MKLPFSFGRKKWNDLSTNSITTFILFSTLKFSSSYLHSKVLCQVVVVGNQPSPCIIFATSFGKTIETKTFSKLSQRAPLVVLLALNLDFFKFSITRTFRKNTLMRISFSSFMLHTHLCIMIVVFNLVDTIFQRFAKPTKALFLLLLLCRLALFGLEERVILSSANCSSVVQIFQLSSEKGNYCGELPVALLDLVL